MVNYYTAVTPQVRNVPVFIQYSNHKELKTDSALNQVRKCTPPCFNFSELKLYQQRKCVISVVLVLIGSLAFLPKRAQAVLQAVSAVQEGGSPSSATGESVLTPAPSPVLRIIIDNMFYPVTLDVLQQVTGHSRHPSGINFSLKKTAKCIFTLSCLWINRTLHWSLLDILQVWDRHEDNHIYQK